MPPENPVEFSPVRFLLKFLQESHSGLYGIPLALFSYTGDILKGILQVFFEIFPNSLKDLFLNSFWDAPKDSTWDSFIDFSQCFMKKILHFRRGFLQRFSVGFLQEFSLGIPPGFLQELFREFFLEFRVCISDSSRIPPGRILCGIHKWKSPNKIFEQSWRFLKELQTWRGLLRNSRRNLWVIFQKYHWGRISGWIIMRTSKVAREISGEILGRIVGPLLWIISGKLFEFTKTFLKNFSKGFLEYSTLKFVE